MVCEERTCTEAEKLRNVFGPKKVDVVGGRRIYTRGSESVAFIR
jgi:hypothetical protein